MKPDTIESTIIMFLQIPKIEPQYSDISYSLHHSITKANQQQRLSLDRDQ